MKILDWMHRRLHPVSSNYTRLAPRNASAFEEFTETVNKPQSPAEIELDIEASLLHHGILSIGTLGHPHSHLLPEEQQQQEEEELKLVSPKTEKPPARITLLQLPVEMFMLETEQSGGDIDEEKLMAEVPLLMEDREKKQRTTLADLLSSESVSTGDEPPPAITGAIKNAITIVHISSDDSASNSALKNCNNKEKMKVIKNNREGYGGTSRSSGSAAAKGIRGVISRMVKKKIHPVVETGEVAPGRNEGGGAADLGLINPLLLSHGDLPG